MSAVVRNEKESDGLLSERAAGGDTASFGQLYERHGKAVYRFARRHGLDTPDAKDITQEVFIAAFDKIHRIKIPPGGSLLPWLLATCRNMCLAHLRTQARHKVLGNLPNDTPDYTTEPQTVAEHQELRRIVNAALAELDLVDRQVVEMCLIGGLSYSQAAANLGVAHGSIRNRLSRARKRLRSWLHIHLEGKQ